MKIVGSRITEIRKDKGISRAELARRSGVATRTIEDWEAGRRVPRDFYAVQAVCEALGITWREIAEEDAQDAWNNTDLLQNEEEMEVELVQKIEDIFAQHGVEGILKLMDRFIYNVGVEKAIKIVDDFIAEFK